MAIKKKENFLKENFLIEKRIRDLRPLINFNNQKEGVLGAQTQTETYTIVLIGDSFAYGQGVRETETFGRVLEVKLNKIRPTKVSILALPGDSIIENYTKFLLARSTAGANLYVFSMVDNDLVYDHVNKYPSEKEVYGSLKKSCPKEEFVYHWSDEEFDNQLKRVIAPSHDDKFSNRCWVESVVRALTLQNVNFFFFSTFSYDDLNLAPLEFLKPDDRLRRKLELDYVNMVEKNGGAVINRLNVPVKKWGVSKKEGHPSKELHALFAETLYQEIVSNPHWGF